MPSLTRIAKPDLFRELGYTPHAGQVLVHRSTAQRRVLACGARWGKSLCAAMEVVVALLQPRENSLGWIVTPTIDLADRVFVLVVDALKRRYPGRIVQLDLRERRLVVRNLGGGTSEVRAKSADQPAGLLGAAVNWLVVDEAARLRDDVWPGFLGPRLIDRNGWALIVSTPRGGGWFCRAYRRGQKGRDPNYASWCSPSWENPYLDRDLIEQERRTMTAEAFQQEFEAEFIGVPPEPCEVCGGPSATATCVILVWGSDEPAECAACGGLLDDKGKTAVPLWDHKIGKTIVLRVEQDLKDPPEMPGSG